MSSLNVCVLGSSSKGNSTLVWNSEGALMIDCGLYVRETKARLEQVGLDFCDLSAVLITHAHGDHVYPSMLNTLRNAGVPVYLNDGTAQQAGARHSQIGKARSKGLLETFRHASFSAGGFHIEPFRVMHDEGLDCYGYSITEQNLKKRKVTVATDLGNTEGLAGVFRGSDVVVLESNHDIDMELNSGRPYDLIQRVFRAHLSNDDCAGFLSEVISESGAAPAAVFLAHISQECNTNEKASQTVSEAVAGRSDVFLTYPDRISEVFSI